MRVLAIDPGMDSSGYVVLDTKTSGLPRKGIVRNGSLLLALRTMTGDVVDHIVCERIASYGMSVAQGVHDTSWWSGRFVEAAHPVPFAMLFRKKVKCHLCGVTNAKDSNVRQAIIDRYGGKAAAIGLKKSPGPLYGVKSHMWAALAVALTWADEYAAATAQSSTPQPPFPHHEAKGSVA